VYVYGRWVRFGRDIVTVVDKKWKPQHPGLPSDQTGPCRRATETRYRCKVLYSYSRFSLARYLTLSSPTSTAKLDYRYMDLAAGASRFYGWWRFGVVVRS